MRSAKLIIPTHAMQQKTSLAAALMHDPKVLVLDGATVGLRSESARPDQGCLPQLATADRRFRVHAHSRNRRAHVCRVSAFINRQLIAVGRGRVPAMDQGALFDRAWRIFLI